jgi:hypothetical protein
MLSVILCIAYNNRIQRVRNVHKIPRTLKKTIIHYKFKDARLQMSQNISRKSI